MSLCLPSRRDEPDTMSHRSRNVLFDEVFRVESRYRSHLLHQQTPLLLSLPEILSVGSQSRAFRRPKLRDRVLLSPKGVTAVIDRPISDLSALHIICAPLSRWEVFLLALEHRLRAKFLVLRTVSWGSQMISWFNWVVVSNYWSRSAFVNLWIHLQTFQSIKMMSTAPRACWAKCPVFSSY